MTPTNTEAANHPGFIRLPKPRHRCPISGLSRTTLNELIRSGQIPAKILRKRGSLRGITIIERAALIEFIANLEDRA